MAARLKFAHLTDIHLPIPGRPAPHDLMNKRVLGYLSWTRKRRHWHKMEVSDALVADMRRQGCDAAFLTGDVVNIALKAEFDAARSWLDRSFAGLPLVLSPGNHDAYVRTPWESSLGTFGKYMIGSRADDPAMRAPKGPDDFPFSVDFGPVRVTVANSSPPTAPALATGALGRAQIERIGRELSRAGREDRFRILLVHHPIVEGIVSRRKALTDRAALAEAIAGAGVDLVLHGHAHVPHFEEIATPGGPAPVIGGGSLSHPRGGGDKTPGRYNLFTLERSGRDWRLSLDVRQFDPATSGVVSVDARFYDRKTSAAAPALNSAMSPT
ncbi:MAG: metallophosphoesterase [Parvularculaceae bacterium]